MGQPTDNDKPSEPTGANDPARTEQERREAAMPPLTTTRPGPAGPPRTRPADSSTGRTGTRPAGDGAARTEASAGQARPLPSSDSDQENVLRSVVENLGTDEDEDDSTGSDGYQPRVLAFEGGASGSGAQPERSDDDAHKGATGGAGAAAVAGAGTAAGVGAAAADTGTAAGSGTGAGDAGADSGSGASRPATSAASGAATSAASGAAESAASGAAASGAAASAPAASGAGVAGAAAPGGAAGAIARVMHPDAARAQGKSGTVPDGRTNAMPPSVPPASGGAPARPAVGPSKVPSAGNAAAPGSAAGSAASGSAGAGAPSSGTTPPAADASKSAGATTAGATAPGAAAPGPVSGPGTSGPASSGPATSPPAMSGPAASGPVRPGSIPPGSPPPAAVPGTPPRDTTPSTTPPGAVPPAAIPPGGAPSAGGSGADARTFSPVGGPPTGQSSPPPAAAPWATTAGGAAVGTGFSTPGGPGGPGGPGAPGAPGAPGHPNGPGAPGTPSSDSAVPAGFPSFGAPDQFPPPPNGPGPAGASASGRPGGVPKLALGIGLGVVALLAVFGIVAGAQADTVPSGTTVAGVDIGGLSHDDAVARLDQQLAPRAEEPVELVAGEAQSKLNPAKSGLSYDAAATVEELTGFSLSPVRMWQHFFGGDEAELILAVDEKKLSSAVEGLSESMIVKAADGAVGFVDGVPEATDAKAGSTMDAAGAQQVITDNWLRAEPPFDLPTKEVSPKITQAEVDAAMAKAEKVTSASVEVQVDGQGVELTSADLAHYASFTPHDGDLRLEFDRDGLVDVIVERTSGLITIPEDAHFEFQGGAPVVVGGGPGTTLKPKEVGKAVNAAAVGDERVAEIELHEQNPEDSKEALEELGVDEVVSTFSTPLTSDTVRTQNLIRGAEVITGDLIKPGETFSLIEALSPITVANGYVASGIVSNGQHVEGVGGGLSQMATTSYNASYFAGFDDVEHRQHSFWFPRYPAGREATIYVGALDVKFKNDTPYGAVLQSYVSNGELTVRIWSTKHYEVKTSDSGHQNVVATSTVKSDAADCEAYPGGEDGFSITNYRKVYLDGQLVKDESDSWTYKPDNPVECKGGGKD